MSEIYGGKVVKVTMDFIELQGDFWHELVRIPRGQIIEVDGSPEILQMPENNWIGLYLSFLHTDEGEFKIRIRG